LQTIHVITCQKAEFPYPTVRLTA